jgi:hypothetical protein
MSPVRLKPAADIATRRCAHLISHVDPILYLRTIAPVMSQWFDEPRSLLAMTPASIVVCCVTAQAPFLFSRAVLPACSFLLRVRVAQFG